MALFPSFGEIVNESGAKISCITADSITTSDALRSFESFDPIALEEQGQCLLPVAPSIDNNQSTLKSNRSSRHKDQKRKHKSEHKTKHRHKKRKRSRQLSPEVLIQPIEIPCKTTLSTLKEEPIFWLDKKGRGMIKPPRYNPPRFELHKTSAKRLSLNQQAISRYFHKSKRGKKRAVDWSGLKRPLDKCRGGYLPFSSQESCVDVAKGEEELEDKFLKERVSNFNGRLRDEPENVELWMEFIDFQDSLKGNLFDCEAALTERVIAERKLEIVEKALTRNGFNVKLNVIRLKLKSVLDEGKDESVSTSMWKELLLKFPHSVDMWSEYIRSHSTRNFASFSVADVTKAYRKCLANFEKLRDGRLGVQRQIEHMELHIIRVIYDFSLFLKCAGFTEKAVAIFQSLIEFNCRTPDNLTSSSREDKLAFFEPFWDSGVARFGEEGAKGWAHLVKTKALDEGCNSDVIDEDELEAAILESTQCKSHAWLHLESGRTQRHWLPWKPTSAGECDDTERHLGFSDIEPTLSVLTSDQSKFALMFYFIQLLDIPVFPELSNLTSGLTDHRGLKEALDELGSVPEYVKTVLISEFSSYTCGNYEAFTREVLRQSLELFPIESRYNVALHHFVTAFETGVNRKEIKKLLKNSLKTNRNDVRIWLDYLEAEFVFGKPQDCFSILETLMSNENGERERYAICFKFIDLFARAQGNRNQLIWFLTFCGAGEPFMSGAGAGWSNLPPTLVAKARKQFEGRLELLLDDFKSTDEVLVVDFAVRGVSELVMVGTCFAWFSYLTAGLERANEVFDGVILRLTALVKPLEGNGKFIALSRCEIDLEACYIQYCKLLIHDHELRSNAPIKSITAVIRQALNAFPNSCYLLDSYNRFIGSTNLTMLSLRRCYEQWLKHPKAGVYTVARAVLAELRYVNRLKNYHLKSSSVNELSGNTVTALVARISDMTQLRSLPLVWVLRLLLERRNSKQLFYRAVQYCPGVKGVYSAAVWAQNDDDLYREVSALLVAKELRLRLPDEELDVLREYTI